MRPMEVHYLGRVEYEDGLRLQKLFGEARARELVPDTLLLLEHPAVLTLGRSGKRANILATPEELMRKGVQVFETNRGGDVTFHGPGHSSLAGGLGGLAGCDSGENRRDRRAHQPLANESRLCPQRQHRTLLF